jgi:protein involved in polysaccharide export with SLBB domain
MVLLLVVLWCGSLVFAQNAGLVVRSPLFGNDIQNATITEPLAIQSYAQQLGLLQEQSQPEGPQRVLSAISSGAYPVTPGDTFRLVYLDGLKTVTVDLQADETSSVTIPGLGTIDGKGSTYQQLRQDLLSMVQTYHSYSNPQLVFTGTGAFTVSVVGEVSGTRVLPAWGLTRLSEVLQAATPYASNRKVTITHLDGTSKAYDLYLALRKGDLKQDPLLQSGDVITLARAQKLVLLGGNVYKPGTYQLTEGDDLSKLIASYGGGVLAGSNVQKIRVQRYNSETGSWSAQYVDLVNNPSFTLQHLDQVVVDTLEPVISSVTIEGAVASSEAYDALSSTALVGYPSGRIFYQFYPGETLRQMLQAISARLLTVSDLDGAYIERGEQHIAIKAQQILYGTDAQGSMKLEGGDTLIIPFNQRFVTVSGAVVRSGVFAYVPDKGVNYYISLAGGLSDDAAYPTTIKVTDQSGNTLDNSKPIAAETTITVAKDTFVRDIAPTVAVIGLVSSILGIVATVVSILVDAKTL